MSVNVTAIYVSETVAFKVGMSCTDETPEFVTMFLTAYVILIDGEMAESP